MPYDNNGKCIHLYKQMGRHDDGKIFRCERCGVTVKAKENKPMFDSDMRLLRDDEAMGNDEEKTSIGMGDKKAHPGDPEAI